MSGDHSNHAENEWDNETLVDRMSIVEEGENEDEQLSDDSLKKNDRAGASNIPFSSSAASNTTTDPTSNDGGVMVSRHVRKNSKRLNITSSSTSFDPKRQKCQTPNRFYFDRDVSLPDFEISFLKSPGGANTPPTSTRNSRKAIIQNRVKRTSSVDSLASNVRFSETFSESDGDAHTPPNTARSRKSSLLGGVHGTPCSVTTRFSLNDPSNINHKFIFSPFTEDFSGNSSHHINNGEKNQEEVAKDFGWIMKSRSADSALAGFYSIALDFDHKKALHEEFLNSRKLKPLEIVQTENVKSSDESFSNATSNSNTFRPLPPPPPSSGTPRIKSLTAPTLPLNPERMTPSILLQNLSLN